MPLLGTNCREAGSVTGFLARLPARPSVPPERREFEVVGEGVPERAGDIGAGRSDLEAESD